MFNIKLPSGHTNMSGKRLRDRARVKRKKVRRWLKQQRKEDEARRIASNEEYDEQCAANLAYIESRKRRGLPIIEEDLPF
jgi:hypothetical protein